MPYLVDGNNVMGGRVGWHRDKRAARRQLLDDVATFVLRARVKMMVVFDGAPEDHFPDGSRYRGVQVFYAERGSTADDRIKSIVDASRERRTLIVVTSDRALADYVRRSGAQVVRAGDFRRRMEDEAAEGRGAARRDDAPKNIGDEGLDHWMRYFGVEPEDEDQR